MILGKKGYFLVGVDAKKDSSILEAAYGDAAGLTAQFNLNTLINLKEKLGGDFNLNNFEHFFRNNLEQGCIQMFLKSAVAEEVNLAGKVISFAEDELLHTEKRINMPSKSSLPLRNLLRLNVLKAGKTTTNGLQFFIASLLKSNLGTLFTRTNQIPITPNW